MLGVSCLILVSQHYHQVIHNRGQHGSSRRLNPAEVHYCSRTRKNGPPDGNALPPSETLNTKQPFSASSPKHHVLRVHGQSSPPHARGDPHNMLSACLPKCRLQKFNPWRQGNAPAYDAANGKPELNVAIWTRCESGQNCGGRPYTPPHAVSALIMDQADKNFSSVSTSRPQNQNPGLLPVPYHQININPKH